MFVGLLQVGDHGAVDDVGEVSLLAAAGFCCRLALRTLLGEKLACRWVWFPRIVEGFPMRLPGWGHGVLVVDGRPETTGMYYGPRSTRQGTPMKSAGQKGLLHEGVTGWVTQPEWLARS